MLITCVGGGNHHAIMGIVNELLERRLPEPEKRRIEKARFYLSVAVSPSSTNTFRKNPFPEKEPFRMLTFEWKFLYRLRSEHGEIAAILLHEIGHTLNPAKWSDSTETEYCADDYARHCGFGLELAKNLDRCLNAKMEGFDPVPVGDRIERIRTNTELKLNLIEIKCD